MNTTNNTTTFFASGSNHSGEIRALSLIDGGNVGVVAARVDAVKYPNAAAELERFVETGRKVFVDSGAFEEVEFNVPAKKGAPLPRPELPIGCPFIAKPLTAAHWRMVFRVYRDVALTHGENAYVVAPDCVAHQPESLERLEKYADDVRGIYDCGATILVPIQKGSLTMAEFYRRAAAILNLDDGAGEFVPSIPMKKDATKLEELRAFVAEIKPAAIHLLGIAADTEDGQATIKTVLEVVPGCRVSCDACLVKRWVGKTGGKGGGPRRVTALSDLHKAKLALDPEPLGADGEHEVHVRKLLAFYFSANAYWTDLGLADVEIPDVEIPADVVAGLEPAYALFAAKVFAQRAAREAA